MGFNSGFKGLMSHNLLATETNVTGLCCMRFLLANNFFFIITTGCAHFKVRTEAEETAEHQAYNTAQHM